MNATVGIDFEPVNENDFGAVFAFYSAAMLPELGNSNLQVARSKLEATYDPIATRFIICEGERVGVETSYPEGEDLWRLAHLHILPQYQRQGIGSQALDYVKIEAQIAQRHVLVNVLRNGSAHAFFERHGFVQCGSSDAELQFRWNVEKFE